MDLDATIQPFQPTPFNDVNKVVARRHTAVGQRMPPLS